MTQFRDRLSWDSPAGEIRDGATRYILLRADTLMGLFRLLPDIMRNRVLEALRESTIDHGGRSAERYQAALKPGDPDLLALVAEGASQLGWGCWTVDRSQPHIEVSVANSPFAGGYPEADQAVYAPIAGMLAAVATVASGQPMHADETACASAGHGLCRFIVRRENR